MYLRMIFSCGKQSFSSDEKRDKKIKVQKEIWEELKKDR